MPISDQRRHHHIARGPGARPCAKPKLLEAGDDEQRARGRDQHADAIGRDVGRHAGGLLVLVEAFDAERVDHDVLRGGGGRDQQRAERDQPRRATRDRMNARNTIAAISSSCDSTSQPRRRPSSARQHRHVERVDQRRPQELDGVGRADQREQADGAEIDAGFAHPHQQRRARQRERQAGRRSRGTARSARADADRRASASAHPPALTGAFRRCGHARCANPVAILETRLRGKQRCDNLPRYRACEGYVPRPND